MNPREEKLRSLLDDVLPSSADDCGPDQLRILEMARHERSRRRQTRVLATAAALAVVASLSFLAVRPPLASVPPAPVREAGPAPLVIHPIDDDQLFALLQSTPSAIMEWPNGDRALLVVTASDH